MVSGRKKFRRDPMVGRVMGDLTVIKRLTDLKSGGKNVRARVVCLCVCGNRIIVARYYLVRKPNPKTHCGCKTPTKAGLAFQTEHHIWFAMQQRCYDESSRSYRDYGAKGVRICARWLRDFENFLSDMGPRPSVKHSIDRIDTFGNYEPDNCRWVLPEVQARNKRRSKNGTDSESI